MNNFDKIAVQYNTTIPPIPEIYIKKIIKMFSIQEDDLIIDLGCGSGLLTIPLSNNINGILGIDISKHMIEKARENDFKKRIRWLNASAEDVIFESDQYKLIICFESFHLFNDQIKILIKSADALKTGGFFCIGWRNFEWENDLKNVIISIFSKYNISWHEWDYWSCPNFIDLVNKVDKNLIIRGTESISVVSQTHINNIISFLMCVDKTSFLSDKMKKKISSELLSLMKNIYTSNYSNGFTKYFIRYCQKT